MRRQTEPRFALYVLSLLLALFVCGWHLLFYYYPVDHAPPIRLMSLSGVGSGAAVIVWLLLGARIARSSPREFLFVNVSLAIGATLAIAVPEFYARSQMPPWPASHLHGVRPEIGPEAWGRVQSLIPEAVKNNAWGQRDREREIEKPPGTRRIAFVGDSFLEESSIVPVSLLVEERLGPGHEVINLGISATHPVDYYGVIENVALELDVDEVVTFIFIGNDFMPYPDPRPPWLQALMAPPPRSSLLGAWLPGLNFRLTRSHKYSRIAWLEANLHASEQAHLADFQKLEARHLPNALSKFYLQDRRDACMAELRAKDLSEFHRNLTNPDLGLFRTYMLKRAVCSKDEGQRVLSGKDREGVRRSVGIVARIQALCDGAGVRHRVVLLPLGPEVDGRIQEQWRVLVDFRRMFQSLFLRAELFSILLMEKSIELIDLYPLLNGGEGNYLNFDGHWSPTGNERVADQLAEKLRANGGSR